MMFEAMAFKFCPIHIKLSTSNSKKALSSCDSAFCIMLVYKFTIFPIAIGKAWLNMIYYA